MKKDKSTDELNRMLEKMRPEQLNDYLIIHRRDLIDEKKAFYYYMKDVFDERKISLKDIYIASGVSESYGGQILRMEKHTENRDLILRFCLAGKFDLRETNRALKLYGFRELYSKDVRDACIIVAISNRIFDFAAIDEVLTERNQKKISSDIE